MQGCSLVVPAGPGCVGLVTLIWVDPLLVFTGTWLEVGRGKRVGHGPLDLELCRGIPKQVGARRRREVLKSLFCFYLTAG